MVKVLFVATLACLWSVGSSQVYADPILVPPGLSPGDTYQLAFVTSQRRDAIFTDINVYNSFVQGVADAAGIGATRGWTWKAIGSTAAVAARDNSVVTDPVYNLAGQKVADGYTDIWDSTLDAAIAYDEFGALPAPGYPQLIWTGSKPDGTPYFPLGNTLYDSVTRGDCTHTGGWWIREQYRDTRRTQMSLYALSGPLAVLPEPSTFLMCALGLMGLGWCAWRRRRPLR